MAYDFGVSSFGTGIPTYDPNRSYLHGRGQPGGYIPGYVPPIIHSATGLQPVPNFLGAFGSLNDPTIGASRADAYGGSVQRRYDMSYTQCMYAKGNQVPMARGSRSQPPAYSATPAPPPPPPPPAAVPPTTPPPPPGPPPPPPPGR